MPVQSSFACPIHVASPAKPLVSFLLHRQAVDIESDDGVLWCILWHQPLDKTFLQGDKSVYFWVWRYYSSCHAACRIHVDSRKRNELLWKHMHPVGLKLFTAIKIGAFDDLNRIPRLLHVVLCPRCISSPQSILLFDWYASAATLWSSMTSLWLHFSKNLSCLRT